MNKRIKISNIVAVFLSFAIGFSLCFYLFNIRVNLGWETTFEFVRMRTPIAKYNANCLEYYWLIDAPGSGYNDKLIDSEFVYCYHLDE